MSPSYMSTRLQAEANHRPAVVGIPKHSVEDASIVIHDTAGDPHTFPVTADTMIMLNAAGMQRNRSCHNTSSDCLHLTHLIARLWPDPLAFKPSRWLTTDNDTAKHQRDAFLAFSAGARRCIGQRFSETESVAILCTLLGRCSVHLTHDEEVPGESPEERRERREKVLDSTSGITITCVSC